MTHGMTKATREATKFRKKPVFRNKPVEIEAMQYDGTNGLALKDWSGGQVVESPLKTVRPTIQVRTLEGTMIGIVGDWIIRGVNGEFHPCNPDIFEATYVLATIPDLPEPAAPSDAEADLEWLADMAMTSGTVSEKAIQKVEAVEARLRAALAVQMSTDEERVMRNLLLGCVGRLVEARNLLKLADDELAEADVTALPSDFESAVLHAIQLAISTARLAIDEDPWDKTVIRFDTEEPWHFSLDIQR